MNDRWRHALADRDFEGALRALERSGCSDELSTVARATLAASSGDMVSSHRVLADAMERMPESLPVREALIAVAARSGNCASAVDAARGFEGNESGGERELVRAALTVYCGDESLGPIARVISDLEAVPPQERAVADALHFLERGTAALSPAVELAVRALLARALLASDGTAAEVHIARGREIFSEYAWRGSLPSFYAALIEAAQVQLEVARFPILQVTLPATQDDLDKYRREFLATLQYEQERLCAPELRPAPEAPLNAWPSVYAIAAFDRSALLMRLRREWVTQRANLRGPTGQVASDLLFNELGYRYERAAIDGYARVLAMRPTLGVTDSQQAEAIRGLQEFSSHLLSQCDRDNLPDDVVVSRRGLRSGDQPSYNPLAVLPMLPRVPVRDTVCDFCEPRPIPPPRELIPPRTR